METALNAPALLPVPRWPAVFRAELRAVGDAVRVELIAAGALMLATTLLMLSYRVREGNSANFDLVDMAWPAVFLGLFAPMAVWKGDEPRRRAYFWALPVERSGHTLAKAASGWAWLMGVVAVYLLWALTTSLLTGGNVGSGAEPATSVDLTLHGHPWLWLVPFTGTTAAYLVGSIVVLAADHPWRWIGGVFFAALILLQTKAAWLIQAGEAAIFGRYGLNTLITGTALGQPPALAPWAGATLLWTALALAGVLAAAFRHQESA